jgi:hypothetical protein
MTTTVDYLAMSILDNLSSSLEELKLSPDLSILRLDRIDDARVQRALGEEALRISKAIGADPSASDAQSLVPVDVGFFEKSYRVAGRTNHALCWRLREDVADPLVKNFNPAAPTRAIRTALGALRLTKLGFVGRYPTLVLGDPFLQTVKGGQVTSMPHEPAEFLPILGRPNVQTYMLEASDTALLETVYREMEKPMSTKFEIGISRFNSLYTRGQEADRLIDAVIGLEALYLSGERDELRFRLSIRAATHIGKGDPAERRRVYTLARDAYDLRSKLVHGALHKLDEAKVFTGAAQGAAEAFLEDVTELLRRAIRSILLEVGQEVFSSRFHAELDRAIVEGSPATV